MVRVIRCAWVALSLAMLVAVPAVAKAQPTGVEKPFKVTGEGVAEEGIPLPGQPARSHWIVGEATHLGRHSGEGSVHTDSASFQPDGTIAGKFGSGDPFVFVAANGDKLACYYGRTDKGASEPGSFVLTIVDVTPEGAPVVTAEWIAEFVVQPELSTGRFAGVTGSWVMYAESEPFVLGSSDPVGYSWDGAGKLTFPK